MHFPCSMCTLHSKMAPRNLVLAPSTAACMVGTTTTMAPSVAEWPATSDSRRPCALQQHMWVRGGNPKVGVPVGFVRPSPFTSTASPFWPDAICLTLPSETCLTCSPPCLSLLASQISSVIAKPAVYEDRIAPASPAVPLPQSEGTNAALVRESAADVSVSLPPWPASPSLRSSVSWSLPLSTVFVFSSSSPVVPTDKARQSEIKRQDRTRPT
jgi:hypothetical protein